MPRHSDPLTNFSHRLVQIKFIIFEIVLLLVFLFFLLQVFFGEIGFHRQDQLRRTNGEHATIVRVEDAFTKEELASFQEKLSRSSGTALRAMYLSAYMSCRMDGDQIPAARDIQKLVAIWKELRKW